MADAPVGLGQIQTINDMNLADVEIADFLNRAPFMRTNDATVASHSTIHKYLRYQNPTVGYRDLNAGRDFDRSKDFWTQTTCRILDCSFDVDYAAPMVDRVGLVNREASRALDAGMYKSEVQMFNGRTAALAEADNPHLPVDDTDHPWATSAGTGLGDAAGHNGFPNWDVVGSAAGDMVVDAGGTAVGAVSSVWLVRSGPQDVEIVTGNNGNITIGATREQQKIDTGGLQYPILYTPISAWYSLKIGSFVSSVGRVANVDVTGTTGTPLDDDLIYSAIAKFGAGREPTHIYMSRAAREALRKSRTAVNQVGAPAPTPDNVGGIPVIVTDGIFNTEPVLT